MDFGKRASELGDVVRACQLTRWVVAAVALALIPLTASACSTVGLDASPLGGAIHVPTERPPGDQSRPAPHSESFGGAELSVEAPFSTATVQIGPDGVVRYEAASPETGIDRQTGSEKVEPGALSRLLEAIQDAEFFSLQPSYPYQSGISYEDGSTYTIVVSVGGQEKEVTCYESECPGRFNQVMNAIREIWGRQILEVGV